MPVIKVSAKPNQFLTTRAIVAMIHRHKCAEIQAIGNSATWQAEAAIASAAAVLEKEDIKIVSRSRIIKPGRDGNEKNAIRYIVRALD